MSRGLNWFASPAGGQALAGYPASVKVVDGTLGERAARYIAVVADAENPFRARAMARSVCSKAGLWARRWTRLIAADRDKADKRVVVAVVDVPSQAYGRREEALGIHQALAGAVDGYARARLAGHPVIALLVGKAMSGAFLAHGYQAQRIIALRDPGVMVHAMGAPPRRASPCAASRSWKPRPNRCRRWPTTSTTTRPSACSGKPSPWTASSSPRRMIWRVCATVSPRPSRHRRQQRSARPSRRAESRGVVAGARAVARAVVTNT